MALKIPTIEEIKKELNKQYNKFMKIEFTDVEKIKIESHHEIIDKMIESDEKHINMLSKACEYMGKYKSYSITNYAVLCENKIVCFTGSDVMDASNLCDFLEKKFPNKGFYISQEFPSIETD